MPRGRAATDLDQLSNTLSTSTLDKDGNDRMTWKLDPSGDFNVKTLSNIIQDKLLKVSSNANDFKWNNFIPGKVNISIWM